MQPRTRLVGVALACLPALFLAGCSSPSDSYFRGSTDANVYVAPGQQAIKKVAIMPFKAHTELIGASVSDLFVTEILKSGKYELVERSQMSQVLGETELALSGLSEAKAAEVGALMGADGVIIGTVDEYGATASSGHAYPVVGISVRLIDCKKGKIMWSVDLAEKAGSKSTTLPQQARSVVHNMMAGLYQNWK
jgi:curli biogenesis system outer membrane secretion channel CsgG